MLGPTTRTTTRTTTIGSVRGSLPGTNRLPLEAGRAIHPRVGPGDRGSGAGGEAPALQARPGPEARGDRLHRVARGAGRDRWRAPVRGAPPCARRLRT